MNCILLQLQRSEANRADHHRTIGIIRTRTSCLFSSFPTSGNQSSPSVEQTPTGLLLPAPSAAISRSSRSSASAWAASWAFRIYTTWPHSQHASQTCICNRLPDSAMLTLEGKLWIFHRIEYNGFCPWRPGLKNCQTEEKEGRFIVCFRYGYSVVAMRQS